MSTPDPTPAPTPRPDEPTAPAPARPTPPRITRPHYPIVYVRGYAMSSSERDETFHDAYYGFATTSVEKREVAPPDFFEADVFEGQLIRFMKRNGYSDSSNFGLQDSADPGRSIWICRFYDKDVFDGKLRPITEHAEDLRKLICETIPDKLAARGVDLGPDKRDYRVILIAHSMGGLVCRTVIQNLLPAANQDPKRWIYRLVTLGSPHRGIELGNVPAVLQSFVEQVFNPFDSKMFQPDEITKYLNLPNGYDPHSLGDPDAKYSFPVKRCLCLIGSDYRSYTLAKAATGSVSDGLVKQSNAYVVSGPKPPRLTIDDAHRSYDDAHRAFWANVHRAHSGYRGIVNSYESYENIQRFLFGDTMADLFLEDAVPGSPPAGSTILYDVEFALTIRGTGVYLTRRQQDPCENALRFKGELPKLMHLHTAFLNSRLRLSGNYFSHFLLRFRVVERRVETNFLGWDHDYPDRPIYSESLEVRIGDPLTPGQTHPVQYRWLSDAGEFQPLDSAAGGRYRIPLRPAPAFSGTFAIQVNHWPDPALTLDEP